MAPTSSSSSERSVMVEGMGTPPKPEWLSEYDEPRPTAPWAMASATMAFIFAISSGVACLRCGGLLAHDGGADHRVPGQHRHVQVGAALGAAPSMYSPKLSNSQLMPVSRASRSMPSTTERFLHDEFPRLRRARHDAEAAVAHHRGGHAQGGRGGQGGVPGHLGVVVGVQVDDARGQGEAVGVDRARGVVLRPRPRPRRGRPSPPRRPAPARCQARPPPSHRGCSSRSWVLSLNWREP